MQAIEVRKLIKKYDKIAVLDNLDLSINEGEFYCLMGPNGSGKTTLSSIIASIRKPTSGEVKIFDKKPEQSKRLIGYAPLTALNLSLTIVISLLFFAVGVALYTVYCWRSE